MQSDLTTPTAPPSLGPLLRADVLRGVREAIRLSGLPRRKLGLWRRCLSLRHLCSYGAVHVLDRDRQRPRGSGEVPQEREVFDPHLLDAAAEVSCMKNSAVRQRGKKEAGNTGPVFWPNSPAPSVGSEGSPQGWAEPDGPPSSAPWKPAIKPRRIYVNNGNSKQK
jgi:hypothetical protein